MDEERINHDMISVIDRIKIKLLSRKIPDGATMKNL